MNRLPALLLSVALASLLAALTLLSVAAAAPAARPTAVPPTLPADHPPLPHAPAGISLTARIATTPRDFFLPGTQPHQLVDDLLVPQDCVFCHDDYSALTGQDPETETYFAWAGSMMAQAGRDPLFWAALDVANADAAGAGEFCLRCHLPRGWLNGRSTAPDGSAMTAADLEGIQCTLCHRLVDPTYSAENPARDLTVLAGITTPVTVTAPSLLLGSGTFVVDPADYRRGPLLITDVLGFDPHPLVGGRGTLASPYHRDAAFCGTCHDISNPLFTWNPTTQSYELNPLDQPGDLQAGFPIERTYSEWFLSAYNTPGGIYAPEFGGNRPFVSTCQDCHMRAVTGVGGLFFGNQQPNRDDAVFHDLTGGNTWVPQIIPLHPVFSATFNLDPRRAEALAAGVDRARTMLQNAASLRVAQDGQTLTVTVVNETGHKLPTGYPEGRRMWLQVEGFDAAGSLVYVSGAYDMATAVLTPDPDLRLYEVKQGLTPDLAAQLPGLGAGPSFHFALNNTVITDTRIPPRGYSFAAFAAVGAAPVSGGQPDPARYADGQYWDTAVYTLPPNVAYGTVRLLYQTASREYVEFLRANNPYPGYNNGEILYDLWQQSGQSAPELMAAAPFGRFGAYLPLVVK